MRLTLLQRLFALLGLMLLAEPWIATAGNLTVWYNQPGTVNLTQGLFLGNGRVGAIIPGAVAAESIVLNESSLWTGTANLSGAYDASSTGAFGAYQLFGNLLINLPSQTSYTGYRRALNLNTGVATVDYTNNGIAYHREMFLSAPDQVLVVRLTADAPGAYAGSIQLTDGHSTATTNTVNGLMFSGAVANGEKYEAQLLASKSGGTLVSSRGSLQFTNCDNLTLVVALGTDYVMDYSRSYHGTDPHSNVLAQVQAAAAKSFAALESAHTNDFQSLFDRVSIDLGPAPSSRTNLPTDQRLMSNIPNDDDPGMDALLFGFGRYLLISGSRTGCPLNLQGIWNDNNNPPWGADYHSDLNLEMMYNPVEVANLSECFQPFVHWLQSQIPAWRYVTTNTSASINNGGYGSGFGGTNGWATRTSHNVYGGQGWEWIEAANAWYCMFVWNHYAFTGDTNYLRNTAYPILKETCQFWQQHLQALPYPINGVPAGTLIVTNGWSPEHGGREDGVTCDQVLIWDLFNNYQQAAGLLNTDAVYAATVATLQTNLLKPRIGPWGELREWFYTADTPGPDGNSSMMQMLGLYPGRQLTPEAAPWLAAGARVKLLSVGDSFNGEWDYVQHLTFYARLHDWWSSRHILALLYNVVEPNLTGKFSSSIMQLDSACGVTAGIAEMLLQSHAGFIELLPTLPGNWPAGSVSGLRARGGYTVGITWTKAAGTATLTPDFTGACAVQAPNPATVMLGGAPVAVTQVGSRCVQWAATAGSTYAIQWVQPPFPAQLPTPADYATGISVAGALNWLSGGTNYQHDLYFGSNSNAVLAATTASPEYRGRLGSTNYSLPLLLTNTPYFWRVDEVSGTNVGIGTLWQFTTSGTGSYNSSVAQPCMLALTTDQLAARTPVLVDVVANSYAINNIYYDSLTITSFDPVTAKGGSVALSDNQLLYTPPGAFSGNDSFAYAVTNMHGVASSALVTVYPISQPYYIWDANGTAAGTGGSGIWDTVASLWNGGTNVWPASGASNFALFAGSAGTVSVAAGGVAANGLYFGTDGYVIQNNTLMLDGAAPVVFIDPGKNANISSTIAGSAGLTKLGSGILTLGGANNYSGGTIVSDGVLALGFGGTGVGTLQGSVTISPSATLLSLVNDSLGWNGSQQVTTIHDAGTLVHAPNNNLSIWGMTLNLTGGWIGVTNTGGSARLDFGNGTTIHSLPSAIPSTIGGVRVALRQANTTFTVDDGPAGIDLVVSAPMDSQYYANAGITKEGAGELVLSGANTYTGASAANSGTLLVNGSLTGGGPVTVQAGATLGGAGTIMGSVTVSGVVAPGTGVGTLSTGAQAWNGGGSYVCEINSTNGTGCDLLNITGTLTVQATAGSKFKVKLLSLTTTSTPGPLTGFDPLVNYTWTIAAASGGVQNFATNALTLDTTAFSNAFVGSFSLTNIGNSVAVCYNGSGTTLLPPTLIGFGPLSGASFSLTFSGPAGQTYKALSSTNVALPLANWAVLTTGTFGGSLVNFTDTGATNARRFYRITSP